MNGETLGEAYKVIMSRRPNVEKREAWLREPQGRG